MEPLKYTIEIPKSEQLIVIEKLLQEIEEINLIINDKIKKYETPSSKLKRARLLFEQLQKMELTEEEIFEKLKLILGLCEINAQYNYYYLKYFSKFSSGDDDKIKEYEEGKEILSETLDNEKYLSLYNGKQSNPAKDLYNLLSKKCLANDNNENFDLFSEYIKKQHNFNLPLIEANERIRLILYRRRVAESKISNNLKEVIKNIEDYMNKLDPEEKEINILTYYIILNILIIKTDNCLSWFERYLKEITHPNPQIENYQEIKKYNNIRIELDEKDKSELIISNKFEKKNIKIKNYCLENLVLDASSNINIPLDILLKRNESYSYFIEQKRKIIDDIEIYKEFKNYFIEFIHSDLMKDVLKDEHKNILELIKSNKFPGLSLDEKYIRVFPLYDDIAQGYTDKDILISFISYFPIMLKGIGFIDSKEKYENIKNVFILFNVCSKFIITLHEIIIHLCTGFLWYLTEGEIESGSPKGSKKSKISPAEKMELKWPTKGSEDKEKGNEKREENEGNEEEEEEDDGENEEMEEEEIKKMNKDLTNKLDGGYYFESLLFGDCVKQINFQLIYILLNGQHLKDNKKKFQKALKKGFNPNKFKKTGLFGKILDKYPINFKLFDYSSIYCNMRQKSDNIIHYERNIEIVDCINSLPKTWRKRK